MLYDLKIVFQGLFKNPKSPLSSEAAILLRFVDQTLFSASLLQVKDADSEGTISKKLSPSIQVYSGHMKLANVPYNQKLEDTNSNDFKDLAEDLQATVSLTPKKDDFPTFVPFPWSIMFDCLL